MVKLDFVDTCHARVLPQPSHTFSPLLMRIFSLLSLAQQARMLLCMRGSTSLSNRRISEQIRQSRLIADDAMNYTESIGPPDVKPGVTGEYYLYINWIAKLAETDYE